MKVPRTPVKVGAHDRASENFHFAGSNEIREEEEQASKWLGTISLAEMESLTNRVGTKSFD